MAFGHRSAPLPSQTPLDLRDIITRAPRIGGARFDREEAEVIIADEQVRFLVHLPALIRGRFVVTLGDLVEIEVQAPIQPDEVVD